MTAPRFCSACGTATVEGARFCGSCGLDLEARVPSMPAVRTQPLIDPALMVGPLAQVDLRPAPEPVSWRHRGRLIRVAVAAFALVAVGTAAGLYFLVLSRPAPPCIAGAIISNQTTQIGLNVLAAEGRSPTTSDIEVLELILESRLQAACVSDFRVDARGATQLSVLMPSYATAATVRWLIETTGRIDVLGASPQSWFGTENPTASQIDTRVGTPIPAGQTPLISGDQFSDASLVTIGTGNEIKLTVKGPGTAVLRSYVATHPGDWLGFAIDGDVLALLPPGTGPTSDATLLVDLSGSIDREHASALITIMRFGQLPYPLQEISYDGPAPALSTAAPSAP